MLEAVYMMVNEMVNEIFGERKSDLRMEIGTLYINKITTWNDNGCHIYTGTLESFEKTNNNALKLF